MTVSILDVATGESQESVAFALLRVIIHHTNLAKPTHHWKKEEILSTYAECLVAVKNK